MRKRISALLMMGILWLNSIEIPVQAEEARENDGDVTTDVEVKAEDSFGAMTEELISGVVSETQ